MKWISIAAILLLLQSGQDTGQLTITNDGNVISTVSREEHALNVFPLMDMEKYEAWVEQVDQKIYHEAQNARIGSNGQIIPGQNGYRLHREKLLEQYHAYRFGSGPVTIEAPKLPVYPKVDSEVLASIRVKPIGYYVTYYNARNKNRTHNINLASKAIDSFVVFPGEVFSFNKVVGIRTPSRGYLPAPVIVRGEYRKGWAEEYARCPLPCLMRSIGPV